MTRNTQAISLNEFKSAFISTVNEATHVDGLMQHKDKSYWSVRRYKATRYFDEDQLYARFFQLLSPDTLIPRVVISGNLKRGDFFAQGYPEVKQLPQHFFETPQEDHDGLIQSGIAESWSLLFFLNQSCEKIQLIWQYCQNKLGVLDFDLAQPVSDFTSEEWERFLIARDFDNQKAQEFIATLHQNPEFLKRKYLTLLIITLLPLSEGVFQSPELEDLSATLLRRQKQLRDYLIRSSTFHQVMSLLSAHDFEVRFKLFFSHLKRMCISEFDGLLHQTLKNLKDLFAETLKNIFQHAYIITLNQSNRSAFNFTEFKFFSGLSRFLENHLSESALGSDKLWRDNSRLLRLLVTNFRVTSSLSGFHWFALVNAANHLVNEYGVSHYFIDEASRQAGNDVFILVDQDIDSDYQMLSYDALLRTVKTGAFVQRSLLLLVEQQIMSQGSGLYHADNFQFIFNKSKETFLASCFLAYSESAFLYFDEELSRTSSAKKLSHVFLKMLEQLPNDFVRVFIKHYVSFCVSEIYLPHLIKLFFRDDQMPLSAALELVQSVLHFEVTDDVVFFFFDMVRRIVKTNNIRGGWCANTVMKNADLFAGVLPSEPMLLQSDYPTPSLIDSFVIFFSKSFSVLKNAAGGVVPMAQSAANATLEGAKSVMGYKSGD